MKQKQINDLVEAVYAAILNCPHSIDFGNVNLKRNDDSDGNSLCQLHVRIKKSIEDFLAGSVQEKKSVKKTYRGQLVHATNGEEHDLVGLRCDPVPTMILAELIQDDMEKYGDFLTVRFYVSDKEVPEDKIEETFINEFYGASDILYCMSYSELTGYLWTDEKLKVGGHDLLAILRANIDKWLHLEIEFFEESPLEAKK